MKITLTPQNGLVTELIQRAIDDCFKNNGGTVELEAGLYTVGSIRIRSNVTLLLRSGAVIKGTRDPEDYMILQSDMLEPLSKQDLRRVEWEFCPDIQVDNGFSCCPGSRWNHALIRAVDAENVRIVGEDGSVIDGSNCYDALGEENYRGPHGISFMRCNNIVCEGYTVRDTGNWAHIAANCKNLVFRDITALAGHDGIHCSGCDNISIERCEFYTGDDCIAGFDNNNVCVKDCVLNTACSAFRFGGSNVLIEKCRIYGPAKYSFRGILSLEDKISGTDTPKVTRKNMLSIFTYYADFTYPIRELPGNIRLKDCTCENVDRVLNYDYSGHNRWQCNRPLESIGFENVTVSGARIPLFLYGDADVPVTFEANNCNVSFENDVDAFIYAANFKRITLNGLTVEGVSGDAVRSWGGSGKLELCDTDGIAPRISETDAPFDFAVI